MYNKIQMLIVKFDKEYLPMKNNHENKSENIDLQILEISPEPENLS